MRKLIINYFKGKQHSMQILQIQANISRLLFNFHEHILKFIKYLYIISDIAINFNIYY